MEEYGTAKCIKIKEVQTGQKKQVMVCFSKESEGQEAITEIKWNEGWNAEVYRNVYNKKRTGKISSIYLRKTGAQYKHKKENRRRFRKGSRKNEK